MEKKIKKAVFPVGGMGTRFLPATKANPKEMLPIVDKPLIQYAVEEAIASGVEELIFVTSYSKRAIEDHFDSNYELESRLEARGKYRLLALVRDIIPKGVSCVYVRQPDPKGLGHAVLCVKPIVGNEPFAVLLADDLIEGETTDAKKQPCLSQMISVYQQTKSSIIAVQSVPKSETDKYGIVVLDENAQSSGRVTHIVEKPKISEAPSTLAAVGRYILTPKIFELLEKTTDGPTGEIQLTDALAELLNHEQLYAHELKGRRFDCGSKIGYLKATVDYALKHPEVRDEFRAYLQQLDTSLVE